MNKKGFVFIETIVMCAILMVGLLVIYNSYTSAIAREKEKLNYNTVAGEIRISLIKKYLLDQYPDWICTSETSCTKVESLFDQNTKGFINMLTTYIPGNVKDIYKIENLYLARCNPDSTDFSSITGDFKNFLDKMKKCSKDSKYRFIAEFKENNGKYSYAWVEYPYVEKED